MNIGLFFGSFNPIHVGHLIIAEYIWQDAGLDEVWLVVSPHNPHKRKDQLLNEHDRLHLCRLAVGETGPIRPVDLEFRLPQPSYTVDTLGYLAAHKPEHTFHLLMGADNLATLHRWKNYEAIVNHYPILVYPRHKAQRPEVEYPNVQLVKAPVIELASTDIRTRIREGKRVQHMLPPRVWGYIEEMNLYRR